MTKVYKILGYFIKEDYKIPYFSTKLAGNVLGKAVKYIFEDGDIYYFVEETENTSIITVPNGSFNQIVNLAFESHNFMTLADLFRYVNNGNFPEVEEINIKKYD
jgi:hypothetical protein